MLFIRISNWWYKISIYIIPLLRKSFVLVIVGCCAFLAYTFIPVVKRVYNANTHIRQYDNIGQRELQYDFEYLMTAVMKSWPLIHTAYSAHGVDALALATVYAQR